MNLHKTQVAVLSKEVYNFAKSGYISPTAQVSAGGFSQGIYRTFERLVKGAEQIDITGLKQLSATLEKTPDQETALYVSHSKLSPHLRSLTVTYAVATPEISTWLTLENYIAPNVEGYNTDIFAPGVANPGVMLNLWSDVYFFPNEASKAGWVDYLHKVTKGLSFYTPANIKNMENLLLGYLEARNIQ